MKEITLKDGTRKVEIRLKKDEHLMVIREDSYYQLGNHMDEIVYSGTLIDSCEVYWNQHQQKWLCI